MATRRTPKALRLLSGPWTNVITTRDPFDYGADDLIDAKNGYIPDPDAGSGFYARPGFDVLNNGDPVTTSATPFRGQGAFSFTETDYTGASTTYNFVVFNAKLYRADSTLSVFTDVTPVGIGMSDTTRYYGTTFVNQCIVTDGRNRPWLLTNPSSTPVTGTVIDFDGMGTTWSAYGPFVTYGGSVFCILQQVNLVSARGDIAWSIPADASQGYQQPDYDFRWTLVQSADGSNPPPITGLAGDNDALTYWRESSIGSISGAPGPNLQGQSTHDAISKNVGTLMPQSIVQYGTTKFFADALGRPYRLVPGNDPEPLWLQMRQIVSESQGVAFPAVTQRVCTAAFEPTLNLYIVAPWSPIPSQSAPATEGYIFDGRTGKYFGRFGIAGGIQLETLGIFIDGNGRGLLIALGSLDVPTSSMLADSGYVWGMNALVAIGDTLTTEDPAPGLVYLTTEDGVLLLTTEGSNQEGWLDNGEVPEFYATTPDMGYDIDALLNVDRAEALVNSGGSYAVSARTSALADTAQGTATATTSEDGVGRLVVGFDRVAGRGVAVTLTATTATEQNIIQQISANAVASRLTPEDV